MDRAGTILAIWLISSLQNLQIAIIFPWPIYMDDSLSIR